MGAVLVLGLTQIRNFPVLPLLVGLVVNLLTTAISVRTVVRRYDCKRFYVKKLGDRKRPRSFLNVAFIYAGNYLLSHTLSRAVPSAQRGLTSVFGMGTGGTPAVRSPTTWSRQPSAVSRQQTLLWRLIPPMRGKLVKDPEDEASQLNRLGETRQAAFPLQSVFVGAQSSVLCLQNCVQVLTLLRRPSAFEQFRTES
jgi:hypothetical protein